MWRLYLALLAGLLALPAPAAAGLLPDSGWLIGQDPVDWTPHVLDGEVRAMAVVGDTVVVGGDFTAVTDHTGQKRYEHWYLFAFQLGTGRIRSFSPWLDGPVLALEPGPDGTVYVGGRFGTVEDRQQRGIVRVDLATGYPTALFTASLGSGDVRAIALSGDKLYIGGTFEQVSGVDRAGLAVLDPITGAVDDFDAHLSAQETGRVKVEDLAVSPDDDRLFVIGAFTRAGQDDRVQAAMFDLTAGRPVLDGWWTGAFNHACRAGFDTWLRAVDFSPDGSYLVVVTTGSNSAEDRLCDTASRFETYETGEVRPTWVNHTGGDSLYAVAIDEDAVYVGGHQRWMDNPHGHESAGPGAVDRQGLAAIDPESGRANEWNPGRKRGVGARALTLTDWGLLVGSDTDELAHEYHGRLGLFAFEPVLEQQPSVAVEPVDEGGRHRRGGVDDFEQERVVDARAQRDLPLGIQRQLSPLGRVAHVGFGEAAGVIPFVHRTVGQLRQFWGHCRMRPGADDQDFVVRSFDGEQECVPLPQREQARVPV